LFMDLTDAIILKTAPYSETTLLVTLLTPDRGVVRALAKGARRKGRQTQAAFEPLAWIQAQLSQKSPDALGTMFSPDLREDWAYLRGDLNRFAYASLGAEVLGAVAIESPPDPAYFQEAAGFLEALRGAPGPGSLAIALLVRLLHRCGFPPQLESPWTLATLPPMLAYHFESGLLAEARPDDSPRAMRLPRPVIVPLLGALGQAPPLDGSLTLGVPEGAQALRWLIRVWEDHLNQKLHAARFLEKMVLEGS
jgi:recombinational DNA repair protein (RecF pathway)